jgi:hypothetical protein
MNIEKYETYNILHHPIESFDDLKGRVLYRVEKISSDEIRFYLTEQNYLRMYHEQDCCESVYIEDIIGDLGDLVGSPLLVAEERNSTEDDSALNRYDESYTWTFYTFRTLKGSVDIRWYGSSNGYYSERVDIEIVKGNEE